MFSLFCSLTFYIAATPLRNTNWSANEITIIERDGPLLGESGVERANEMTIIESDGQLLGESEVERANEMAIIEKDGPLLGESGVERVARLFCSHLFLQPPRVRV